MILLADDLAHRVFPITAAAERDAVGRVNTITGLILIHVVQDMSFTTLFCRNY